MDRRRRRRDLTSVARPLVLELPCEVMEHIAIRTQQVSHMLALRQVCSDLRHQLEGLRVEIQRFRWQQSLTRQTAIDRLGWTLRWTGSGSSFHPGDEWAAAGRLPSCGAAVWLVGISAFAQQATSVPKLSRIYVGVCNEAGTSAWALHLADGRLRRWSRDAAGRVRGAPTPANFPNGYPHRGSNLRPSLCRSFCVGSLTDDGFEPCSGICGR